MAGVSDAAPHPQQVSIEQPPTIVAERARYGNWEGDTVIGAAHQQALVTLNERKSRYTLIAKVERKTAEAVSAATISLLTPFAAYVHTLTTDNGKEFAQYERIASCLVRRTSSPIPTPGGSVAPTRT